MKQLILVIIFLFPLASAAGSLDTDFNSNENYVSVEFQEAELTDLIIFVAEKTNASFIFYDIKDQDKKVTWVAQKVHLARLAYSFCDALSSQGYVVRDLDNTGRSFSISKDSSPLATSKSSFGYKRLNYLLASTFEETAKNFYNGRLSIYPVGDEVILVSGSGNDVGHFINILDQVDQPKNSFYETVPLKYISTKVATEYLEKSGYESVDLLFYPDAWNHAIVLKGLPHFTNQAEIFLRTIDRPRSGYENRYVALSSMNAETVIKIMNSSFPDLVPELITEKSLLLSGENNELSKAIELIGKMDASGVQVRIEAVIAYLTDTEYREIGMRFQSSFADIRFALNSETLGNSFSLLSEGFKNYLGLDFAAQDTSNNGVIVSSPILTVLNGETARLQVGQNVPYLGEATKNDSGELTGQSVERKDVGITFSVTPVVDPSREFVNIEISQIISSLAPETEIGDAIDVIFNNQEMTSTVRVADGEVLFLGGLSVDDKAEVREKVPFLGYIPYVGEVFTYKGKSKEKRNLVVSLRVNIIS
jgi:general secretion pathway protein D